MCNCCFKSPKMDFEHDLILFLFFLNFWYKKLRLEKVWLGRSCFGLWGVKNSTNILLLYFIFQGILVISKTDLCFWVIYIHFWGDGRGVDRELWINIAFAKGGPRFPIAHALRLIATTLQAHMPAVRPEMTIWGVKSIFCPFDKIHFEKKIFWIFTCLSK